MPCGTTQGEQQVNPSPTLGRKDQHLDVVLSGRGRHRGGTGLEGWQLVHEALPDLDFDAIDLTAPFLGYRLKSPFLISSMTGGPARARDINYRLAEAARECGIALAVGSQRAALEDGGSDAGLDRGLRDRASGVPILANIGAAQLTRGVGRDEALRLMDMIGADALIVHLNPVQEACQPEGDRDWRGVGRALEQLVKALDCPVVVKETGAGLSVTTASRLQSMGVAAIDVAGAGGANWALIEGERAEDPVFAGQASAFAQWGIPTAEALIGIRHALPEVTLIGSGGIRDGVDAAKAIRLGADLIGVASGVITAATRSTEAVVEHFAIMERQLRTACFCVDAADIVQLKRAAIVRSDQPSWGILPVTPV